MEKNVGAELEQAMIRANSAARTSLEPLARQCQKAEAKIQADVTAWVNSPEFRASIARLNHLFDLLEPQPDRRSRLRRLRDAVRDRLPWR